MQIAKNTVVTIDYTLTDDSGNVIDQSTEHGFAYLHGASNIIPGLETALDGKIAGSEVEVAVAPEDGYGVRDESKRQDVPRSLFPDDVEIAPGMQFQGASGDGQAVVVTVLEVGSESVTVDGNHPLAGVNLNFRVKVVNVRGATEEEISHGHVHG